jgi:hypothetical protein
MKHLEQIKAEIKQLSATDQAVLRDWLCELLEDRLELTDIFKAEIATGREDIAAGRYRIHRS